MLFSSATFLFLFLPFSLGIYYVFLKNKRTVQNVFLFLVSILFYSWGEPAFALVMLFSIVANYCFGIGVYKYDRWKKHILLLSIIFNISILFVFKYLGFFVKNLSMVFGTSFGVPQIALPLGISFFTFQAMSYVIDVYRGEEVQKNVLNVGLYIAFFPQLIAGPIVRYKSIAYQIQNRRENWEQFSSGICRFIVGLGKKAILSNTMAIIADAAFNLEAGERSVAFAWLGAIAYTFQIYFDFGGYSDMAIGLGGMFGFDFMENFDYPYISSSITEFWRRWHISLGSWFRDYVYFPLGGSRVNSFKVIRNLFVVWLLTGIWHGANFTFILWGLMYFVLLVVEKITGFAKTNKLRWLKHIYTLFFVVLGWVLFRSDTVMDAIAYIGNMFGGNAVIIDNYATFFFTENLPGLVLCFIFSTPWVYTLYAKKLSKNAVCKIFYLLFLLIVFVVSVIYIVKGAYNPFIYFNF